ncbi:MAG: hypothetical protein ACD_79C00334G0009 [uncultured bacterium]|nr:MAG: hypothetical protein ACD_79C00334G0009 [uncultured bacterium]
MIIKNIILILSSLQLMFCLNILAENTRNFKLGCSPIPRYLTIPNPKVTSTENYFINLFTNLQETGELATTQVEWWRPEQTENKAGDIPQFIDDMYYVNKTLGYTVEPMVVINFFRNDGTPLLQTSKNQPNDWTNIEAQQKYEELALEICEKYNPQYLGLSIEANNYYLANPVDFDRFVDVYKNIYKKIKLKNPKTKVFVTFQLEKLKGLGDNFFGNVEPHWDILDKFGDTLDLFVFTTYPETEFKSPKDIPDDYYSEILNHTKRKIAISECGWGSDLKRSARANQANFIHKIFSLTDSLPKEFMLWAFMNDLNRKPKQKFDNIGLCKFDGTPKQSFDVWKKYAAWSFTPEDIAPPSAPPNLKASDISSSQVTLTWDESEDDVGVTGYTVYKNNTAIANITTNTFIDRTPSNAPNISYTVSALDSVGNESELAPKIVVSSQTN